MLQRNKVFDNLNVIKLNEKFVHQNYSYNKKESYLKALKSKLLLKILN